MNSTLNAILSASLSQSTINWQQLLSGIISSFNCTTGTIHLLDKNTMLLKLQAHQGVPEFLLPKMSAVPIGKGMAGIAAERRQPVEMCNLQTDNSGVARPAAKETKVEGSIAAPMLLDGELYGILGVAKSVPYDFTKEEVNELMEAGAEISHFVRSHSIQPS